MVVRKMENVIEINGLSFGYQRKKIFDSFSLTVKRGVFLTIIGNNSSGKTSLVKLITGLLPSKNEVRIMGIPLNKKNAKKIRSYIGAVFDNPNTGLIGETVMDSLAFPLENLKYDQELILSMIADLAKQLKIESLLRKQVEELSGGEKQLISLASVLIRNPQILILDCAFTMLDSKEKERIYKILKKLHKTTPITIINITQDIEESIYGDEIALMKDGKLLIHDQKEIVYSKEKLLRIMSLEPPFMVSLSTKLGYYHLVDNVFYDMNEMVDVLWK